jgi:hypothetical protein
MSKQSRLNKAAKERDKQAGLSGKSENDFNKMGEQRATQKNEGRRTPESRHDRESHIGGDNQSQSRQGSPASGEVSKNG